jgi:predicted phage terminase large subunit-like protein
MAPRTRLSSDAPVIWKPNPGPQTRFLASSCYELMYGGQAGGGKSEGIAAAPLRWVHLKHFRAVLFRNTYLELKRTLLERTAAIYEPAFGARWHGGDFCWNFPSGAKVWLSYLDAESDALAQKSAEYQFAGFDELTSFKRFVYTYMLSRMRSSKGIPIRVRSGTNPGDTGHEWVFERWRAWLDPTYPNPAKGGEVRWFLKLDGQDEEIEVPAGTPKARSRCFIPARLSDTPQLAIHDPDYESRLDDLDPVTRAQLKQGNWLIKPGRGQYFKRGWVNIITELPRDIIATVRYWDFAGTERKTQKHDPDWTSGVRMSLRSNGRIVIEHRETYRGEPAEVERRTRETAVLDGDLVRIGLEQDPGQAGKFQMSHFVRLLHGFDVETFAPTGSKIQRFSPFSAQAQNGNVDVLAGPWVPDYFNQLEQFPEGGHDDDVDATSGAYMMLCGRRSKMADYLRTLVNKP